MYSTRCPHCRQLVQLKTEEVRAAVEQMQAEKKTHYEMHCPKCRKLIKLQVKELKRKLPPVEAPQTEESAESAESAPSDEQTTAQ